MTWSKLNSLFKIRILLSTVPISKVVLFEEFLFFFFNSTFTHNATDTRHQSITKINGFRLMIYYVLIFGKRVTVSEKFYLTEFNESELVEKKTKSWNVVKTGSQAQSPIWLVFLRQSNDKSGIYGESFI